MPDDVRGPVFSVGLVDAATGGKTVVFALYDKVTLQDVAAPMEIFARANDFGASYRVLTVSPSGRPVGTTAFATHTGKG